MAVHVYRRTLRDQRRALAGWGGAVTLLVLLMAALWPSVHDIFDAQLLQAYPEPFQRLFDLEAMATGAGFLNAELFGIILPGMFIAYGVGRGARLIAGEEQDGVLEVIVVTPVSRTRLLLEKAAALATGVIGLGAVLLVVTVAGSVVMDMAIPVGHAVVGVMAMVLIGVQHGWLALAVGAATGRRSFAVVTAVAVAVAGYALHVVGALVDTLAPWQPLSPFTQAIDTGPVSGTVPVGFAWLALTAGVFLAAAVPLFSRRDLASV